MNESPKRALVAVDVNNLWHSCRQIHGPDYRVDYGALKQLIRQLEGDSTEFRWVAYAISVPYRREQHPTAPPRNQRFIESLGDIGYTVKVRHMFYEKDKAFGSDWDVGIAVDAMRDVSQYDIFYLASGDGDYIPLINQLTWFKKRVEVVTFKNTTSHLLYQRSHRVTYLSLKEVFKDTHGKTTP